MSSTKASGRALPAQLNVIRGDIEGEVITRYAAGAQAQQAELCCPTVYDHNYLKILPQEIIEKDYGCGDPSKYVRTGETVLDLGSGAGKICYILSQKVGAQGKVIGVDFNDAMLSLARQYQDEMAEKIGYSNIVFRKGKIQDLSLALEPVEQRLVSRPVQSVEQMSEFETFCEELRATDPLVAGDSVDVIVSNCVLNLVRPRDKRQLFDEMYRVLRKGGRCVISDIVCDEPPTEAILNDPELWSGCIAGALEEGEFLAMFEQAGFYGISVLERQEEPWRTIDGVQFRSLTVLAYKGKEGPCLERNQAVVYKGPWKCVKDDDGHTLCRGEYTAVCDKTYRIMTDPQGPYAGHILGLEPLHEISLEKAQAYDCNKSRRRGPRELKGVDYNETRDASAEDCCGPECC